MQRRAQVAAARHVQVGAGAHESAHNVGAAWKEEGGGMRMSLGGRRVDAQHGHRRCIDAKRGHETQNADRSAARHSVAHTRA